MNLHKNARLTPQGRALLVQHIRSDGWEMRPQPPVSLNDKRFAGWHGIGRAMRRADGVLLDRLSRVAVPSSFRFLVAHSVTTRRPPVKPLVFLARHSAAPFWLPSVRVVSSCARNRSSELILLRNMSLRPSRTTWRTSLRDLSVRRMISLIATPRFESARDRKSVV